MTFFENSETLCWLPQGPHESSGVLLRDVSLAGLDDTAHSWTPIDRFWTPAHDGHCDLPSAPWTRNDTGIDGWTHSPSPPPAAPAHDAFRAGCAALLSVGPQDAWTRIGARLLAYSGGTYSGITLDAPEEASTTSDSLLDAGTTVQSSTAASLAVIGDLGWLPDLLRTSPITVLAPSFALLLSAALLLHIFVLLTSNSRRRLANLRSLLRRPLYSSTISHAPLVDDSVSPLVITTNTGEQYYRTVAPGSGRSAGATSHATGARGGNGQTQGSRGWIPARGGRPLRTTRTRVSSSSRTARMARRTPGEVKIMYWNIFHHLTLKLTDEEFHEILHEYDILLFAETDMLPGEDETVDVPRGYILVSLPRKPRLETNRRGGGVALLIREDIVFVKSPLTSPDILVLDLGSMWLIGAYIPPVTSRWQGWTDIDPFEQLWETVALCTQNEDKPMLLLADINGRIAHLQVPRFSERWPRNSSDAKSNARGQAILRECEVYGLCIMNGTSLESASPGRFTSWQPGGQSTIDYALVSESLIPLVRSFHVECPAPDPKEDWADHTRICITLDAAAISRPPQPSAAPRSSPDFAGVEPIDVLYQETMDAKETPEDALASLYGPVMAETPQVHVYVEGVAPGKVRTKSAGAGVYFGPGSTSNISIKVPGPERPTADRARIYAIHEVLRIVDPDKSIIIFCTSKAIIRQLCYSAAKKMNLGWPGANADIFKSTVLLLSKRHGQTKFVHVERGAKNDHGEQAYFLAKASLKIPHAAVDFQLADSTMPVCNSPHVPVPGKRKVVTDLEESSPEKPKPWKDWGDRTDEPTDESHRGRAKVHALQSKLRTELLACKDIKEFWDFVRRGTDPRPKKCKVSLSDLSADFNERLNPPKMMPASFDAEQLAFNARMARDLNPEPLDRSPRQSYTRDITMEEIEWMKRHISEHGLDTAVGVDDFSYKDCLAIPNEKLLEFFLYCVKNQDMPKFWLIALLIGILKKDKDATDPAGYRLIALECCMLKMLTLIIDRRLREGAEDIGAIPKTQNGFQDHLRTNDNPFVLLCLIDKAQSLGKPLFVAYLDLKNAFPGTERSTLWVKLAKLGISGPMIEWLKRLYDRIRYIVRQDGRYAPAFRSLLGILTGDPGSPHLWNLFMSDFILAHHPEDVELNGVPIAKIEHADDIMTASSCPSGFQIHLNGSQAWADKNGCITSKPKCVVQIFGTKQKWYPSGFYLGEESIKQEHKACYLGLWFETGSSFIWREQYRVKSKKASKVANVILGLDRFVGTLPTWDLRTLYMARVDPYLIAGCEVCLDVEEKSLKLLEKVQCKFLRRMLGVGSRSMKAILFSETGIWPIRYRRVYLALKNLCYWIGLEKLDRPAWHALQASLDLARAKKMSWINDLRIVLSRLYVPVQLEITGPLDVESIEEAMKAVQLSMEAWIDHEIETCSRTKDLLADRLELDSDTGRLTKKSLDFRHYLRIKTPDHRRALTRMILSSHSLAVERRRWKERGKNIVPREWRKCRFCHTHVEDPAHAMFVCDNPGLMQVREVFLTELYTKIPEFKGAFNDALDLFKAVLAKREVTPALGKLAFNVLKVYDATPMLIVEPPVES